MGVEEGDRALGEVGVAAQGGDGLDDARRRVLREALEHRVPALGHPGPHRLAADRVGQERAEDGEPVLAAHLGHGEVERAQAQVDVGEDRQSAPSERISSCGVGGCPVALQQRVVVAGPQELRHDGQRGRLDVGRDRIAGSAADGRGVEAPRGLGPDVGVGTDGAQEVDGQRPQRRRAVALARRGVEAQAAVAWAR